MMKAVIEQEAGQLLQGTGRHEIDGIEWLELNNENLILEIRPIADGFSFHVRSLKGGEIVHAFQASNEFRLWVQAVRRNETLY